MVDFQPLQETVEQAKIERRRQVLIHLIILFSVVNVVHTIFAVFMVDDQIKPDGLNLDDQEFTADKNIAEAILVGFCILSVLCNLLGIFGAHHQNYCLILTYAILMTLVTSLNGVIAMSSRVKWGEFLICLIITLGSYQVSHDIKKVKGQANYCCCTW